MTSSSKTVLVAGGTRGLGLIITQELVGRGHRVFVSGRNEEAGKQLEQDLGVTFFRADVRNPAEVEALVARVQAECDHLSWAVNNVGITTKRMSVADTDINAWRDVLDTNLLAALYLMKAEIGVMRRHTGASIVNVSSCAGLLGVANQSAYSVSKAALNMLSQVAALENAQEQQEQHAIRINAICPGPILGGMNTEERLRANPEGTRQKLAVTAMKRFADPKEIAALVLWLLSDDASYMTGTVLPIDGGYSSGKF